MIETTRAKFKSSVPQAPQRPYPDIVTPLSMLCVALLGCLVAGCRNTPSDTAVLAAVKADDVNAVKQMIADGGNINASREDGMSALMIAIFEGHDDIACYLVDAGSDLGQEESITQMTPLTFAAAKNRTNVLRKLLQHAVDVDHSAVGDFSALLYAASSGHYEATRILLEAGADPNYVSQTKGYTALQFATAGGRKDIVELLLKYGATTNSSEMSPSGTVSADKTTYHQVPSSTNP